MLSSNNQRNDVVFFFLFYKLSLFSKYSITNFFFLVNHLFLTISVLNLLRIEHGFSKTLLEEYNNAEESTTVLRQIKKNHLYYFKLIKTFKLFFRRKKRLFKNFIRFNKYFKHLLFNNNLAFVKKLNLWSFNYYVYNLFPLNFISNARIVFKNWHFLTGNLISPFYSDLISPKNWIRRNLMYSLHEKRFKLTRRKRYKLFIKRIRNVHKNKFFFKKVFSSNFFYFNKLNIKFSELTHFIKVKFGISKKNTLNWYLTRPYLFLNNRSRAIRVFSNSFVYRLFKKYTKTFRLIKRSRFKFWRIRNVVFRKLTFKNKRFLQLRLRKFFIRYQRARTRISYFNFKKHPKIFFKSCVIKPKFKIRKLRTDIRIRSHLRFRNQLRMRKKLYFIVRRLHHLTQRLWFFFLKSRVRYKVPRRSWLQPKIRSKYIFTRKLKFVRFRLNNFRKVVKYLNIKHKTNHHSNHKPAFTFKRRRRIRKSVLWNFLKTLPTKFIKFKWKRKKFSRISQLSQFSYLNKRINKSRNSLFIQFAWNVPPKICKFIFKRKPLQIYNSFKTFKTSYVYKKTFHPIFASKRKTPFLLSRYGFTYLSESLFLNKSSLRNVANLKRNLYSFSYKNELHRYILKRYTRRRSIINLYSLSHKLRLRIKESKLSKNLINFGFNSTMQTLESLMSKTSHFINKKLILQHNDWARHQLIYWKYNRNNEIRDINIKRVRFKPGYMSLWRNARQTLKLTMGLKMRYQYKLTRYLSQYSKFIRFKTFLVLEMQLNNVLVKSRLLPDYTSINLFIKNNLIFVNGSPCINPLFQIFINDFIQLIINIKYYILYRWFSNWELKKKIRLRHIARRKFNAHRNSDEKQRSYLLPKWILFSKNSFNDISKYLEVDYFTLSAIVLYEPFMWSEINSYNFLEIKFGVINLYNWKYIT